jgi:hypothetical protein
MKKLKILCTLFFFLNSCSYFVDKVRQTRTVCIVLEKEQDNIVKSWVSMEPAYMEGYKSKTVLKIDKCRATLIKLFKERHFHFDYEVESFDFIPTRGKQIVEILLYDHRDNLLEKLRFSFEVNCAEDGFSGKREWVLKSNTEKICSVIVRPYSHSWKECDYFDIKSDKEKSYR